MSSHEVRVLLTADPSAFMEGLERAVAAAARLAEWMGAHHRRHHPLPLCIDGHAYRRRQRRRRSRR